jgi:MYXO-CTERM domain-containing protein
MLLSAHLPRWARAGLFALVFAAPASARADAVPPPPSFCPPGTQAVTSHHGPECVKVAPKNCPRGWHGVFGGTCSLQPCVDDSGCQPGEACVEHLACLASFVDDLYDSSDDPSEEGRAEPRPPPDLLAGPPLPRRPRRSPVTRFDAVNLCSAEVPCGAPRQCLPEKICVPRGTRGLAYAGTNITPARVARKTEIRPAPDPASPSSAPAPSATAPPAQVGATASAPIPAVPPSRDARPLEGTAPISGGCAGCATTDASVPLSGLGILGLAAILAARRRR